MKRDPSAETLIASWLRVGNDTYFKKRWVFFPEVSTGSAIILRLRQGLDLKASENHSFTNLTGLKFGRILKAQKPIIGTEWYGQPKPVP